MFARAVVVAGCLFVVACGSPLQTGTDGAAAQAGQAGQGGAAGLAMCTSGPADSSGASVSDNAGQRPRASVTVSVTVASVASSSGGARITLSQADGQRWIVDASFSDLPTDIVTVGEALDLRVDYHQILYPNETAEYVSFVLSRAGSAVVFAVDVGGGDLTPYDISIVSYRIPNCMRAVCLTLYGADVTYGAETRSVAPGEVVRIGKLTLAYDGVGEATCGDSPPAYRSISGFTAR